jgi:hypothetical protein
MTPEAAKYAARRQFGNATKLQEQSHEAVSFTMETVLQDLRFAMRQPALSPCAANLMGDDGHRCQSAPYIDGPADLLVSG